MSEDPNNSVPDENVNLPTSSNYMPEAIGMRRFARFKEVWRRFYKNKLAVLGLCIFVVILLTAIFASVFVPYEKALVQDTSIRNMKSSAEHWFGTDNYGRDIFYRIIHGARYSLFTGIGAVIVGIICGGILGALAGFKGGLIDAVIMRFTDTFLCIPFMLLVLAIVAALGTSLINVLVALMLAMIPTYARVIRSAVLTVVGMDYIEAARSCGAKSWRIILKHIIPNAIGPIIVQATMNVGTMIIWAAGVSFLGMGIQPPTPEWGAMLSEGKNFITTAPHMVLYPGLAIALTALSLNLMGDGLRDALDPRLKD